MPSGYNTRQATLSGFAEQYANTVRFFHRWLTHSRHTFPQKKPKSDRSSGDSGARRAAGGRGQVLVGLVCVAMSAPPKPPTVLQSSLAALAFAA